MTLREKDIEIQCFLHNRLAEDGIFLLKIIHAKRVNRIALLKAGYKLRDEDFKVTPQEELFAQFFNSEKAIVADMPTLELRAHREELAKIAFEARARLTAVDDEERARKAKAVKEKGPTGFSTSLQVDEIASEAINRINIRQKKLTKQEKLLAGLEKLGISTKDAEKLMSAGTILGQIKKDVKPQAPEPGKPIFVNPFAKPPESKAAEVSINEETQTVVITKAPEEPSASEKKPVFVNPFAK